MSFADEQLLVAAAKLAEATSDSEEYQRALYHYTQLVRHRMANPLHIIGGMAATLTAQPDLPPGDRQNMLDEIYRQVKILERVCLEPKIMHPAENELRPTPSVGPGSKLT
jgi:signal transduction histidine kinase